LIEKKIKELKTGLYNLEIKCRILSISSPKIISTRKGETVIRDVIVGDETGKTRLTLWGEIGGSLKVGSVVKIVGAWTSSYKSQVNLNAGSKTKFEEVNDPTFPTQDKIPNQSPYEFEDLEPKDDNKKKRNDNKKFHKPIKGGDDNETWIELD